MFRILLTSVVLIASTAYGETAQDKLRALYLDIESNSPKTKSSLTAAERETLFLHVNTHPVASRSKIPNYDHQPTGIGDREVGFCYGRAMAVHLAARRFGLAEDALQKIYLAGDLKNGGVRWRFHMATMVHGDDGKWYIIDPIMPPLGQPGVIEPGLWMKTVKDIYDLPDGSHDAKFYLTDTSAIMVDMSVIPAAKEIEAQEEVIGERLINVTFDPVGRSGFTLVPASDLNSSYDAYRVSGDAKSEFFINFDEPGLAGKPVFNFDFFHFATVIFYRLTGDTDRIRFLTRTYDYNGYFSDLIETFRLDHPLPDLD